MKVYVETTVNA